MNILNVQLGVADKKIQRVTKCFIQADKISSTYNTKPNVCLMFQLLLFRYSSLIKLIYEPSCRIYIAIELSATLDFFCDFIQFTLPILEAFESSLVGSSLLEPNCILCSLYKANIEWVFYQ